MTTARDILQLATERTDKALRGVFGKDKAFIRFTSGHSATIEYETTKLVAGSSFNPFPLVAMFTEGLSESVENGVLDFRVPKVAIVIRTRTDTTEVQKLDNSFKAVLHPIFEEFSRQLRRLHFGYDLRIERTDLPCVSSGGKNASLNQLCDAVIIRNLRMKCPVKTC